MVSLTMQLYYCFSQEGACFRGGWKTHTPPSPSLFEIGRSSPPANTIYHYFPLLMRTETISDVSSQFHRNP